MNLNQVEDASRFTAPPDCSEEEELSPYEEGWKAAEDGETIGNNPYGRNFTELHQEWARGWNESWDSEDVNANI